MSVWRLNDLSVMGPCLFEKSILTEPFATLLVFCSQY